MLTHGRIEKLTRDRVKGRHADGKGLMLNVTAGGSASWVVRLMSNGRRRDYGLGGYPDVSLSMARFEAAKLAEKVKAGRDPVAEKRRPAAAPTLREALAATLAVKAPSWRGGGTAYAWRASLENHAGRLLPMPVDTITRADVLATLAKLADRPTTARYVRQRLRRCFAWAEASGHITANPCGDAIAAALPATPRETAHYAALDYRDVGAALRAVDATAASLSARLCLRFWLVTHGHAEQRSAGRTLERDRRYEAATWDDTRRAHEGEASASRGPEPCGAGRPGASAGPRRRERPSLSVSPRARRRDRRPNLAERPSRCGSIGDGSRDAERVS